MKKLKFEQLPFEVKKDIFLQVIEIKEPPKVTAKKYNISVSTLNKIVQEYIFENINETADGVIDITPEHVIYKETKIIKK